jgi:hypothetical protein
MPHPVKRPFDILTCKITPYTRLTNRLSDHFVGNCGVPLLPHS